MFVIAQILIFFDNLCNFFCVVGDFILLVVSSDLSNFFSRV